MAGKTDGIDYEAEIKKRIGNAPDLLTAKEVNKMTTAKPTVDTTPVLKPTVTGDSIKNDVKLASTNPEAFEEKRKTSDVFADGGKHAEAVAKTEERKVQEKKEQEVVEKAKDELDKKSDSEVVEGLNQVVEETDSPEVESKFKSIWQAWLDKDISKSDRNYLIIDALATFASNAGRNLRNIGAQYTGGTIDTSHDTSIWEQQSKAKAEEMAKLGTRAGQQEYTSKDLANEAAALSNEYQKMINEVTPEKLQLDMEAAKQQLEALGLQNEYQAIINSRTPEQLDRNIESMVQKIEANDVNLQNLKYSQAYANYVATHFNWLPDFIKQHMIAKQAQKGVGDIGETAGTIIGNAGKTFLGK